MEIRLDGKRALVTGGNSGIGEAIVLALAAAGARVAINYLVHPETAHALVERIQALHGEAVALQADISDTQAVEEMFNQLDRNFGGIDILINNAGMDGTRAAAWEADLIQWKRVVEVNLFGALHCSQQALARMVRQRHGVVLSISSVHETIAWSGYSAYCASKAAVGMMIKTIAQEAAPYGVRALALAPGAIRTDINRSVWSDPEGMRDLLAKIPLGRIGTPEEIAEMAVILVSDKASYLTGRTVFMDGGMTDYPVFSHGG